MEVYIVMVKWVNARDEITSMPYRQSVAAYWERWDGCLTYWSSTVGGDEC